MDRTIVLYANQPMLRVNGDYYATSPNFTDFLANITAMDSQYILAVPCKKQPTNPIDLSRLVKMDLPKGQILELPYYQGHFQAPLVSLISAWRLSKRIRTAGKQGNKVILAGPGPNSFLFWCSWLLPQSTQFAYFIRGDTIRTLQEIYRRHPAYLPVMALVHIFRWRILRLLRAQRAHVFTYGAALQTQYPCDESKRHVVAPLINEHWIRTDSHVSTPEDSSFRVLYVGRLSREKNIINLIEACALARNTPAEFQLTVVGEGPMRQEIEARINELQMSKLVKLTGLIPNGSTLMAQYDAHDLLCLPSHTEATPRVVVEAVARGLPVLSTNVGSIESMFPGLIRFTTGFSATELKDGISACLTDRAKLRQDFQQSVQLAGKYTLAAQARFVLQTLVPTQDLASHLEIT